MKSLSEQIALYLWREGRTATPARKISLVREVMALMHKEGLLPLLPATVRALEDRERASAREYEATSAKPLTAAARKAVERLLPKDAELHEVVSESVIGGMRLKIQDDVYDGTLRGGLQQLRNNLKL